MGISAWMRSSPRISQPRSISALITVVASVGSRRSWISSVSVAPQMPVRRILAFMVTSTAICGSALASRYVWQMPSRWAKTGTRASFCTRATRVLPPRGTMTSIVPSSPRSISPTASRSVVGTIWIEASGRPAALRPATRQAWMARDECALSEPPRRITALPDLSVSAPASAVTFGRLSKITPMTPSGVRTRAMSSPLGRVHSAITWPTGSGSSAMVRSPSIMPSIRLSLSCRRSRKAFEMPFFSAATMSSALASRISRRALSMASAAPSSACRFFSDVVNASTAAAALALRPISAISAGRVITSAMLIRPWPPGPSARPYCRDAPARCGYHAREFPRCEPNSCP